MKKHDNSRREFLRLAALGTAALGLGTTANFLQEMQKDILKSDLRGTNP